MHIAIVAIVPIVALTLAACSGGNGGGSQAPVTGEQTTITFAAWEYEHATYQPHITAFAADNPNIHVVLVPMEDILQQEETTSPLMMLRQMVSRADTAPAIGFMPEAVHHELLLDLAPLMDADTSFSREDFYTGALDYYATDGKIWVLPRSFRGQIMAYNANLFAASGLESPQAGDSWQTLFAAAETIAATGEDYYGFFDPSKGYLTLLGALEANGVDLTTLAATDVALTSSPFVEALDLTHTLIESGAVLVQDSPMINDLTGTGNTDVQATTTATDPQSLIQTGHIGLWDHEYSQVLYGPDGPQQPTPYPFTMGTAPYPETDTGFLSGNDGYIISSGTRHPEAAWKWIAYLSRQHLETSTEQYLPVSQIPACATLAQQRGYWESLDETTAEAYQWTLAHAGSAFATPDPNVASALLFALDEVRQGSESSVALGAAQAVLEEQIVAQQATPPPTQEPVTVATPQPAAVPEGATAITFAATNFNPADMRQAARDFQAQHNNLFVQIQPATSPSGPPTLAALAQGNDCFATFARLQNDAEAALLRDLAPMIANDEHLSLDDYPAPLTTLYQYQGQQVGLPYAYELRTLSYNATAFQAAGLEPPDATWTPDDFLSAAQALVADGDIPYGYMPMGSGTEDLFFFIRQYGGQLFTGTGQELRPNFNDPQVVAAIAWYLDLARVHQVMPRVSFPYQRNDMPMDGQYDHIQSGEVGMWFDYGYGMFSVQSALGSGDAAPQSFEVGVAPLPVGGGGLGNDDVTFSIGLFISANTAHPEACWQWLRFLSEQPSLARWSTPARLSVAHADTSQAQTEQDMGKLVTVYDETFAATSKRGIVYQVIPEYVETYWLLEAINRASQDRATNQDEASLAAALSAAQQTTTAFLACVAEQGTPGQCAREVDPDYNGYLVE
jgi:multiple sugar transport system substrate-binding protein